MTNLRTSRPGAALVVSIIALIVALGGTSYAAFTLPKNSVGTKQLKNGAVTGAKIAPGSITGSRINAGSLGTVPSAINASHATSADNAGPAANADNAGHAANADNADNAGHAANADNATNAVNATTAASATNAGHAQNADHSTDAANLGGQPASPYALRGQVGLVQHVVGGTGEPGFQNSWGNYLSGFSPAGFYADNIGTVHLQGVVTGSSTGTTVFTLPPAYRPITNEALQWRQAPGRAWRTWTSSPTATYSLSGARPPSPSTGSRSSGTRDRQTTR